jgi:hypothetical protein
VTVNFDILPRQALLPSDFKALGRSIRRWLRLHAKQQGSVRWYDTDSLEQLLKGQPPRSVQSQEVANFTGDPVADYSGTVGDASGVSNVGVLERVEAPPPVCLSLIYNKIIDDRQILANVRRALSTELVADVLINGQSWDNPV